MTEQEETEMLKIAAGKIIDTTFSLLFVAWFVATSLGAHYFFQVQHPPTPVEVFIEYCAATFIPYVLTFFYHFVRCGSREIVNTWKLADYGKELLRFLSLTGVVVFLAGSTSISAWVVECIALIYLPYAVFTRPFWKLSRTEKRRVMKHKAAVFVAAFLEQ